PGRRAAHIVDSQTHIWSGGKPTPSQRQEPFLAQDLLQEMSAAGVERAIIITPSWNPSGNEYPLEAAKAHPDRFRVMGLFNVAAPPDAAALGAWNKREGMAGVRFFLGSAQARAWMTDDAADAVWPVLERGNSPTMI